MGSIRRYEQQLAEARDYLQTVILNPEHVEYERFSREAVARITGWKLPRQEHVYFIQAGFNGAIKIGRSHNPYKRMAQLQTGQHERLRMLLTFPGGRTEERILHFLWGGLRMSGEWFENHPQIQNLITAIRFVYKPEAANDYQI